MARDLTNEKFGRLVVLKRNGTKVYSNGKTASLWECRCDCGNIKNVTYSNLIGGCTHSCGCQNDEKRHIPKRSSHLSSKTRLYSIWANIKSRCQNPNRYAYANYGGRGISVCEEWLGENGFANFQKWSLANGYSDELSIDRIDNDGNYSPQNCKWSTKQEQARNRRTNVRVSYKGKTYSLYELSELTSISVDTLRARLNVYGFDVESAVSLPLYARRGKGSK